MANKIRLIGCGGAGCHLVSEVGTMLGSLGEGFCSVEKHYLDTSTNNISDEMRQDGKFFHITSKDYTKDELSGSGAERRTNASDIVANVKDFLDNNGIKEKENGVFNIVIASLSGGSGSIIMPTILKNMLLRDIPTIVVAIGDSTNGLSAINTLNSIATLHNIAKQTSKPISIMYVNNESFMQGNTNEAIANANKSIFNSLSALSLFLSGENESIDNQDMINIIDQSNYKTIKIKPGLYSLNTYSKEVILPDNCVPTVARTLTINGISPDINLSLLHHKTGTILAENAINIYKEHVPIHLVTFVNFFTYEETRLKKYTDSIYDAMHAIEVNEVSGSSESETTDDGLVF